MCSKTLELCGRHTADVGQAQARCYEMGMEMWANVSPAGAVNQLHAHPGAVWSAVYYVDDGGDAEGVNPHSGPRERHRHSAAMSPMVRCTKTFVRKDTKWQAGGGRRR